MGWFSWRRSFWRRWRAIFAAPRSSYHDDLTPPLVLWSLEPRRVLNAATSGLLQELLSHPLSAAPASAEIPAAWDVSSDSPARAVAGSAPFGHPVSLAGAPPPNIVYVDARWSDWADQTLIPDADPVAVGEQPAVLGEDAFSSVQLGLDAAASGGAVVVNAGTYHESVQIVAPLTVTAQGDAVTWDSLSCSTPAAILQLNGTTLTVGGDDADATFGGTIAGVGSLVKTGAGTLTLAGDTTYTGSTVIDGGTLLVNGLTASGNAVSVNSSGTLGGTGLITDSVSVAHGATLSPGSPASSIGQLTAAAVTLEPGADFAVQLDGSGAGAHADQLTVLGRSGGQRRKSRPHAARHACRRRFADLAHGRRGDGELDDQRPDRRRRGRRAPELLRPHVSVPGQLPGQQVHPDVRSGSRDQHGSVRRGR